MQAYAASSLIFQTSFTHSQDLVIPACIQIFESIHPLVADDSKHNSILLETVTLRIQTEYLKHFLIAGRYQIGGLLVTWFQNKPDQELGVRCGEV